jgi:hypothetical protein
VASDLRVRHLNDPWAELYTKSGGGGAVISGPKSSARTFATFHCDRLAPISKFYRSSCRPALRAMRVSNFEPSSTGNGRNLRMPSSSNAILPTASKMTCTYHIGGCAHACPPARSTMTTALRLGQPTCNVRIHLHSLHSDPWRLSSASGFHCKHFQHQSKAFAIFRTFAYDTAKRDARVLYRSTPGIELKPDPS